MAVLPGLPVIPFPRALGEIAEQRGQHGVPRTAVSQEVQQQRQVLVLGLAALGQGARTQRRVRQGQGGGQVARSTPSCSGKWCCKVASCG